MRFIVTASLAALFMTACAGPITNAPQGDPSSIAYERAKQEEMFLERFISDLNRLDAVGVPILLANVDLCPAKGPHFGVRFMNLETFPPQLRDTASRVMPYLNSQIAITHVVRGTNAAKAGIRAGDRIIGVNGEVAPTGKGALTKMIRMIVGTDKDWSADFLVERKGKGNQLTQHRIRYRPDHVCDYFLDYSMAPEVNAYADGSAVYVTRGMMNFVKNDNELALIVAHEIAHNANQHVAKMQQNAMAGMIGGLLVDALLAAGGVNTQGRFSEIGGNAGARRYSVAFEQEADYVGMYMASRAGYKTTGVADLWRRMAIDNPNSLYTRTSHPTSPERFIAIEETEREIAGKRRSGKALVPNLAPEIQKAAEPAATADTIE